jgi:hypothetical protein
MSDNIPDKRTVPVLTEVIDAAPLPPPALHQPPDASPQQLPDLGEPLIDLSDEGLHLPVQEPAALPLALETPAAEVAPAASMARETTVLPLPELDDEALRQLLSQTIERAIPSLVELLLPEVRQLLQAQLDSLAAHIGPPG